MVLVFILLYFYSGISNSFIEVMSIAIILTYIYITQINSASVSKEHKLDILNLLQIKETNFAARNKKLPIRISLICSSSHYITIESIELTAQPNHLS